MGSNAGNARFGEVITAMVTPFDSDENLDIDDAIFHACWLVENGSDGLVLAGTTGEGSVLSDSEKAELWRSVVQAVTVPVIAGTGTNDTRHSIELTRLAKSCGVEAALVVTPYYNRPSAKGIYDHFAAVASSSSLPVIAYDIPKRSGRSIGTDNLVRLARNEPNIVGVKDAVGDPTQTARLICESPVDFEVYSGDDAQTLPLLAVGAVGVISVASHWVGPELSEMIKLFSSGDVVGARRVNGRILDSFDFESSDEFPNPLPTKAVCRALGFNVGQCREPMGKAPVILDEQANKLLSSLGRKFPLGALAN